MPLTPVGIAAPLTAAMYGSAFLGIQTPQLAFGIGTGVSLWTSGVLVVTTVDVGTLGAGVGSFPCLIPAPLLTTSLLTTFAANGILGVHAAALANAIGSGLAVAFATQGLVVTAHPTVGVGTATALFLGPSSVPSMLTGLASVGMVGTSTVQLATAVGLGIDMAFAAFPLQMPIVGPPAPSASSGVGLGKIV